MPKHQEHPPESPSAIAMRTGMDVPGGLEAIETPDPTAPVPTAQALDLVPGQSGAEGAAMAAAPANNRLTTGKP